jgi:cyclic 2,3-diphosphoglycerate synthase
VKALALIDGEHYAPTVRAALLELPYEFVAAVLLGGTEKLREGADYGVQLFDDLGTALREIEPAVAVDLSDEPVLGPRERFRVASRVLAHGVAYVGPDFRFDPPALEPFAPPSLAVFADGKRVGKTAVSAHVARVLGADHDVVAVAMGRGGPESPALAETPPTVGDLLELSRGGAHAASDYLEIAAVSGVVTVGCRRCGGGLAGAVASSNVPAGLELVLGRSPDLVVFDGSGAAIPPVDVDKRILVTSVFNDPAVVTGYLNEYRILLADLVVVTMAGEGMPHEELIGAIRNVAPKVPVVAVALEPRPLEPVSGRRVAYFTTAAPSAHERIARALDERHGADVVHVSGNLSNRARLAEELERVDAEVFLTEIKAAGIDVVAEAGAARGIEVVLAGNDVLRCPGQPDLDAELRALAEAAIAQPVGT